jgi:hypothetical protein
MSLAYFGLGLFLGTGIGFFVAAFFKVSQTEYPDDCWRECPYKVEPVKKRVIRYRFPSYSSEKLSDTGDKS